MGVVVSRVAEGKIQESFVVARSLPASGSEQTMRTIIN
jgi:hypothetical protein